MSEVVTWTTCPRCGAAAAIGWLHATPIEFDCRAGCSLTDLDRSMTAAVGLRVRPQKDNRMVDDPVRPLARQRPETGRDWQPRY